MSELSELAKSDASLEKESVLHRTLRLTINLLTNILMCLTVIVCLLFASSSKELHFYHWHIILCVLGYQFFMSQGTLVTSRYNSWSMFLSRQQRKYLHLSFQLAAFILILVGSSLIACKKSKHFETMHGSLGLCAVITSIISMVNGALANNAYKISISYLLCIKYIHYLSGIITLFLSASSLTTALQGRSFRLWMSSDDAVGVMICITWVFTLLVAFDFWLRTGNRLRNLL